jgi:hypothetical protein
LVVEPVGDGDVALIPPAPITRLITTDQDHATLARVEGKKRSIVAVSQLLHVAVARALDRLHERCPKGRTNVRQAIQSCCDVLSVPCAQ